MVWANSFVKRIEMHDLQDDTPLEKIWYRDLMPEVRTKALSPKRGVTNERFVVVPRDGQ